MEINQVEIETTVEKINKNQSWVFKNLNKNLARLTKKKLEKTQITKIRNKRGDITTDPRDKEINGCIRMRLPTFPK